MPLDALRSCKKVWDAPRCIVMLWVPLTCSEKFWDVLRCFNMLLDAMKCLEMLWDLLWETLCPSETLWNILKLSETSKIAPELDSVPEISSRMSWLFCLFATLTRKTMAEATIPVIIKPGFWNSYQEEPHCTATWTRNWNSLTLTVDWEFLFIEIY